MFRMFLNFYQVVITVIHILQTSVVMAVFHCFKVNLSWVKTNYLRESTSDFIHDKTLQKQK